MRNFIIQLLLYNEFLAATTTTERARTSLSSSDSGRLTNKQIVHRHGAAESLNLRTVFYRGRKVVISPACPNDISNDVSNDGSNRFKSIKIPWSGVLVLLKRLFVLTQDATLKCRHLIAEKLIEFVKD